MDFQWNSTQEERNTASVEAQVHKDAWDVQEITKRLIQLKHRQQEKE